MKKTLFTLLAAITILNVSAQENTGKTDRFSMSFNQGVGFSNPIRLNGQDVADYYFSNPGVAASSKYELAYAAWQNGNREIFLSSGFNLNSYSLTGNSDKNHEVNYSAAYYQIPISFGIKRKNEDFSTFLSAGIYFGVGQTGSMVSKDLSDNTLTRVKVTSNSVGLQTRIGAKVQLFPTLFYVATLDASTDLSDEKFSNNGFFITNGIGFNF